MNKVLCSLLVIAIIGIAQGESFKRIHFDQGRTHVARSLEDAAPKVGLEGETATQTVVAAKILNGVFEMNGKEVPAKTPMAIYLHSAESGFCSNSEYFQKLDCPEDKGCSKDTNSISIEAGKMRTTSAHKVLNEFSDVITLESSTAWKLTTKPVIVSNIRFSNDNYPPKESSYGFIGLGTKDAARKNFIGTETPTFSLSVNGIGKGSLIFGKDSSLVQANRKEITWKTDANWISTSSALFAPKHANTEYKTKISFDLTQEKTSFPISDYNKIFAGFNLATKDGKHFYDATEKGALSKLSPVIITIDGANFTIPVEALFKVEDTKAPYVYTFMVEAVSKPDGAEEQTIFGTRFLSSFYTVFTSPKAEEHSVHLNPTYTAFTEPPTKSSSGGKFLIGLIAVIGLGAVGFIVFRNKAASKLQEHLNEK